MKHIPLLCAGILLLATPSFSQDENSPHPYKISSDLDHAIKEGLHELYNLNFEKSLAIFDSIKHQEVDHPMVAFGVAATHWWRISSFVLESDKTESQAFLDAADHCMLLAEELIKNGDPTGEGHHVLGGTYGLLGRWQATNHEFLSAYWSGKKAYRYLVKALDINPRLTDAYMGRGIFDYFVATLPPMVRSLAFIGMGGNPQVGIDELKKAAAEGTYAVTATKLFLMQIYSEQLRDFEKALPLIEDLRKEYPRSPFMHMTHIIVLFNAGRLGTLFEEVVDFGRKIEDKTYPDDFWAEAHFAQALPHFKVKEWEDAADHFQKAASSAMVKDPWRTWGGLYLGYCYDAMGKRVEAKQQYRWVLNELRRWGSHDNARRYLKRPFKGTENEIKKLVL